VQAQNFTGFRDSHNQRFAFARGGRKLNASLTEDENSPGTLSFDKNHRVFWKNSGVFYFIESLGRRLRQAAEKIAGTQMAIKTAFNTAQAGHAHWRSFISSQKRACVGLASSD